ncbi:MAG: Fic family protein [Candidatus Altiarchaeota archaeon]
MAYIERREQNGKRYFYVTKNFRVGLDKWRKIRRYCGDQKPSPEYFKRILDEIDAEAKIKCWLKEKAMFKYLSAHDAELLEDVKQNFNRWYGKLDEVSRKKFDDDFLVRFTYNSNAIEGNRLSLRETSMILSEDIIPAGASTKDFNEAINGKDTLEYIRGYKGNLGKKFMLKIHESLTKNTGCRVVGGFRDSHVRISGSEWTPPTPDKVPEEIDRLLTWWRNYEKKLHPAELAGIIHNMLVRLHPFTDGDGRTSRVVMNWILMRKGYPMAYIDNKEKIRYYHAIEEGDKGDDSRFIKYLAETIANQHTSQSKEKQDAKTP